MQKNAGFETFLSYLIKVLKNLITSAELIAKLPNTYTSFKDLHKRRSTVLHSTKTNYDADKSRHHKHDDWAKSKVAMLAP